MIELQQPTSPLRGRSDLARTEKSVKHILADGTPRWVSHPEDFKNWAIELYQQEKEQSIRQVAAYRMEEQETLSDEKARMVNPMEVRAFIKKLRDNRIKCFLYQVPPGPKTPPAMVNTVGLWAEVPSQRGIGHLYQGTRHQYMTWMDIPFMYEWSVLRLDDHQLPIGEKHRGWRTVLSKLICRKVLTETKAHQIFGAPGGATSCIYKRTLFEFRNGRCRPNERTIELSAE